MNFEQFSLDPRIMAGVKAMGYTTPTPIQQQAIPVVLAGKDVLGLAQTGTGKTAAFVLPMLQHLSKGALRQVRALIVAPTRELAEQIHQAIVDLGKNTKIRSITLYGGVGKGPQVAALRRGPEIVVACPGRLLDHIGDGNIDLSRVELLVLDEADRMCDMGFLPDVRRILGHLPKQRQTLFFSATMPDEIRSLADSILKDPVTVQIGMIAPATTVSHALYPVPEGLKKRLLLALLKTTVTGRTLIFTRTKRRARTLALDLSNEGYNVAALQGNMAQNRRLEAMNGFRDGKYDILVATDIAARGIDVAEIAHVINFDMPDTVDAYTHRIGRTGRALQTGEALTFAVADDVEMVRAVERVLGETIERRQLSGFDYSGVKPETILASASGNGARQPQRNPRSTASSPRAGQGSAARAPFGQSGRSAPAPRRRQPQRRSQG
ncbi:MAG: DEAD/DEAH box helicase [Caldilineaceae bacterium]|nr:DEAD/DEAH box helicase [Caldilineaceae bacterium]